MGQSQDFRKQLKDLIKTYTKENASVVPDFILTDYLLDSMDVFTRACNRKEEPYNQYQKLE